MKERSNEKNKHSDEELRKQKIQDLERLFNMDLGSFLVLNEEGKDNQIKEARDKLRSHLHKYSDEMVKEAEKLGGDTPELVKKFVHSIEQILDHMPQIDPAQLSDHHKLSNFLETLVKHKFK